MADDSWKAFTVGSEIQSLIASGKPYREFLRVPSMSMGIYQLPAGAKDLQGPHDEDEVYFVVSGRARLRMGDEDAEVGPGSILYVKATEDHTFFEIEEELTLLVFFSTGSA